MPLTKRNNAVGLIGLIVSAIGFIFACIPGALILGWVLLPIGLVLGIVGVCLSGKSKGTSIAAIVISIVGIIVGVIVFLTVVSDAVTDAFKKSDFAALPPTSAVSPSSGQASPRNERGSRGNPFSIGDAVQSQEWNVTLGAPYEAGAQIAAENQFNSPPEPGMEFWIVPVTATYTGDKTGNLAFGVTVKFVGSDNRTYGDRCGVVPNQLSDVGDLYNGGVADGNICVAVPAGADGLWTLSTGFASDPAFFTGR